MKNLICITGLLIWIFSFCLRSMGQQARPNLAVHNEGPITIDELYNQYSKLFGNSERAKLLLRISHVYWYSKTTENHFLDSCFFAAQKANSLCNQLAAFRRKKRILFHDVQGING